MGKYRFTKLINSLSRVILDKDVPFESDAKLDNPE